MRKPLADGSLSVAVLCPSFILHLSLSLYSVCLSVYPPTYLTISSLPSSALVVCCPSSFMLKNSCLLMHHSKVCVSDSFHAHVSAYPHRRAQMKKRKRRDVCQSSTSSGNPLDSAQCYSRLYTTSRHALVSQHIPFTQLKFHKLSAFGITATTVGHVCPRSRVYLSRQRMTRCLEALKMSDAQGVSSPDKSTAGLVNENLRATQTVSRCLCSSVFVFEQASRCVFHVKVFAALDFHFGVEEVCTPLNSPTSCVTIHALR